MGLKVWLPLNGDLHNQGTSNYTITAIEVSPTFTAGKIGQCYQRANTSSQITNGLQIQDNLVSTFGTAASVAVWVKPLGTHTHYNGTILSSGNWNAKRWAFGVSQDNSQVDVLCGGYNNYISCAVPVNQWTHLVSTFENGVCKLYKNGVYVGEKTGQAAFDSDANWTGICRETYAGGYFGFNGCINDLRIYDYCLSAAEVREISQGLVLHYKLDQNITVGENIMPNSLNMGLGSANPSTGTWRTAGSNSMTRSRVAINDTPEGSGYGFQNSGIQTPNDGSCYGIDSFPMEANTDYIISMWARITSGTEGYAGFNVYSCTVTGGSWTQQMKNYYVTPLPANGAWTKCWMSYKTNTATTRNIYIGITTGDTDVTTQMCNIHIEKGTINNNNIIEDSSGYNHNGILTNTAFITSNTPRYSNAIYLSKVKINCTDGFPTGENPNFTISFWTKILSTITYVSYGDLIGMYDTGQGSNTFRLELCGSPASNNLMWFRGPSGQSGGGFNMNSSSSSGWFSKDTWHHIVLAGDGINKKYYCYLDGNLCQTYNGSANSWQPTGQWYLGDTTEATAYFSDLRIYCTALDADAIRQLYEVGAKVDNKGNLHTFEINEFGANRLTKTGIMKDYMVEPYKTLSDGSHWQLMMFHYVDEGRNMFTSTNASYCNDFGLYSRLRDIDKFKYTDTLYEFYVIQDGLEYRWTQTNAPATSSSPGTVTTVSGYNNPSVGLAKNGSNTYLGYNSWWGACGCWTVWQGNAIPGFGGRNCTKYLALYARVSKSKFKLATQNAYAENFIEL